jgi:hypothetical protein
MVSTAYRCLNSVKTILAESPIMGIISPSGREGQKNGNGAIDSSKMALNNFAFLMFHLTGKFSGNLCHINWPLQNPFSRMGLMSFSSENLIHDLSFKSLNFQDVLDDDHM